MKALNILPSLSFLTAIIIFAESCTNEQEVEQVSTNRLYVCYIEESSENEKKQSSDIFITQQLNDTIEYGMCFGNKTRTINNNFDFKYLYVLDKEDGDMQLPLCPTTDKKYINIAGHDTDYIVAMRLCATDNTDGDYPQSTNYFTGGFHGYQSETYGPFTPTMREISKKVYINGKPMQPNTYSYCDSVRIVVENLIQGSNTEKKDGSGRDIIKQVITLTCHDEYYNILVDLIPLEDVLIYQSNGLCFYNDFDNIQFIGSKTHTETYPKDKVTRADKCVNTIRQFNNKYVFDVYMDLNYGIGNQQYNESSSNASIESACKSYFVLIDKKNGLFVPKGSRLSFRGGYRFNTTF